MHFWPQCNEVSFADMPMQKSVTDVEERNSLSQTTYDIPRTSQKGPNILDP